MLIQLQECDNRISKLLQAKQQAPLRIQKLEEDTRAMERQFSADEEQLEAFKKERRQLEREIQELDGKIEKSSAKLTQIKSNKEYTAVLKEIDDLKTIKFQAEERTIQMMETAEELERKCKGHKDELKALSNRFEKEKEIIEGELLALEKALGGLQKERSQLCGDCDQGLLKRYLFLRERKGGLAISSVVTGVCQTCHMGLPPQKFNELIRGNDLMTCPHCNRIIYWGDDQDFQKAPAEL
ncbi:MAG: zinc ribbon domain-containing protein [Deltaproteobacteria bacterium]